MKFALQILLGDFHIAQGHTDIFVPEQLHESEKANPESEHLSRESVSQPVGVTWVEQPPRFAAWANADRRAATRA
jgi:hypothetical protein